MNGASRFGRLAGIFDSVFVRCAALMAMTTIVVAGVMAEQASRLAADMAVEGVVDMAEDTTLSKAFALVDPMRFMALPRIEDVVNQTMDFADGHVRAVVVLNPAGEAVVASESGALADGLSGLGREALRIGGPARADDGLSVAYPVRAADNGTVYGAIAVSWSAEERLIAVKTQQRIMVAQAVGLFVIMMILTLFLLRRSLGRPLSGIAAAVERVTDGDYGSEVAMQERRDEIGSIARSLATLAARLAEARAAEEARIAQSEAQARVVEHLGEGLGALAQNNLTHHLSDRFPQEYEMLRTNYQRALDSLNAAIRDVNESAGSIRNGADEIARASDDLSRRTETQAATLEQTAAALEQLLTGVRTAAEGAAEADRAVRAAREMASRNGDVMRSAVGAMAAIETSSEQIGEIISVIDDIAFQTNLLALNAGVEAARAGSSGKGFAVVASEVRALAQRSSDAARQIKDLISGSTEQVKTGVRLVERAGVALDEVVARVGEISDLVSGMAEGAGIQAEGLQEINAGVSNLDRVTQQNAAMVEQSTAAAHQLRAEAGTLNELVGRFRLGDATVLAAAAKGRAA